MNSVVEEIKQKIDIVDLIGSYVTLKHAGKYFKATCPFHQEKTPSFVVSPDIQRWHCFGACHEGGDIFNFVMKWENISFSEALQMLAERAGVNVTPEEKRVGFQDDTSDKKETIYRINELALKYYAYVLLNTSYAEQAQTYLTSREVPEAITQTFGIGYAPEGWSNLRDFLLKKAYSESSLMLTGLFVQGEKGIYDRFRGRIMFPIYNTRGKVEGFSGRLIKEHPTEKDGGKYVNTPETLVYHKRESLYGLYFTKEHIRKANSVIVVEGEFDMLIPYTKGITNIVAIKGSAFTEEQLHILRRYTNRLFLALDSDKAGFEALKKTTLDAQRFGFELYVCAIPGGKDPDEAARKDFVEFKKSIEHPIPVYDHIIDTSYQEVWKDDPFSKKTFVESAIPYIHMIENPIVRTHYVQKVASLLDSTEETVLSMLKDFSKTKRVTARPREEAQKSTQEPQDRALLLQKHILAFLLTHEKDETMLTSIFEILKGDDFSVATYRDLYNLFSSYTTSSQVKGQFSEKLRPELRPLYDELFLYSSMINMSESTNVARAALEYKKLHLTETIQKLLNNEQESNDAKLQELNAQLIEVEKRLASV